MLSGAVLYAKDLNTLIAFYASLGGQIVEQKQGEYGVIGYDNGELSVVQSPDQIASQIVVAQPPVARTMTPLKPVFRVGSLNDALNTMSTFGGMAMPGASEWSFRDHIIQDVVDPEGNIIQLQQAV